jgi:hypothetical protein
MKEKEIKELFFKWILENEDPDTIAINEFAATYWYRRADLLVVNGCIQLVEIKSEKDNLTRLEAQIEYFLSRGHKVTLIVAKKHKDKIRFIPEEVGVFWLVDGDFVIDRLPKRKKVTSSKLAEYWRLNELRLLFRGIMKNVYKMHIDKLQKLFSFYPDEVVGELTCALLKARYRKYYHEVRKKNTLFLPRVAKNGIEDPRKDYPDFFTEARKLLLQCDAQNLPLFS